MENHYPKISIIIPVYNAAELLRPCLDSLIGQSLKDIEIICVDDGSKDSSLDLLGSYKANDPRMKVISQTNKGSGGARNTGLDAACGKYILFVDADDYVDSDYCVRMYDMAEKYAAEVAVCGIKKINSKYTRIRYKVDRECVYTSAQQKLDINDCPPMFYIMNKLFLRESLQRIGLRFEENVCYEDVMFLTKALCEMGDLVSVPELYYMYVNHSSGVTKSRQTLKKQTDRYLAHKAFVGYCAEQDLLIPSKFQNITVRFWDFMGLSILKIKERGERRTWRLFDLIPIYTKKK